MLRRVRTAVARLLLLTLLASTLPPWTGIASAAPRNDWDEDRPGAEERKDRPVEATERRTPASRTMRNPDGTFTTELYSKPIHFMDPSGKLQPINNTLVADAGAATLRNAANRYKANFTNRMGPEFFGFQYRGRSLHMSLEGARPQQATWLANRLTYGEAFDQVDVTYTVANDFVKEEIILKSPDAPASFDFTLRLNGLKAEQAGRNGLHFADDRTGEALFAIPSMFMRDAAGALSSAVAVETQLTGNRLRLTVTPDAAWLQDPARAYPVVIDPTIALQPDYAGGLDTTIANAEGLEDLNLGFESALSVGSAYSSLLKFDLSAIPRASAIDSATLRLSNLSTAPTTNTTGIPTPDGAPVLSVSDYTSSLKAGTYTVVYTLVTPLGETLGSRPATISIADYQAIDVGVGAMPSGVTGVKVYLAAGSDTPRLAATSDRADVTLTALPAADAAPVPVVPENAPTLAVSTKSSTLTATTYSVRYTYVTSQGETQPSPAATITATSSKGVDVNVGAFPPGVTSVKVYFGTPENERYATTISTGTTATVTAVPASTAALPPGYSVRYTPTPTTGPQVSAVAAPTGTNGFAAGMYYVRYTYLNSLGETPASPATQVMLSDGQALSVTVGRLPVGIASANVYVGLTADTALKLGNIAASASSTAQAFGTPPAAMATPAPQQMPAVLPDPTASPTVERIAGTTPFVAGTYDVAYTFFGPNGETRASAATAITLTAGDSVKVTAATALPAGATGMRVYMGRSGETLYLVGTRSAVQAGVVLPWLEVKVPADYRPVTPPTSSTYAAATTPTVTAMTLTAPTRLDAATYYIKYTWIYPDQESAVSSYATATITKGQALEVKGGTPPAGALGMRVYMGRTSTNLSLVATSMGSRTVVTGDVSAPAAPSVNTAQLAAPLAGTLNPSALPAGTYYVAYTLTNLTGESAPSPAAELPITAGQTLEVALPDLPEGVTGANVYVGTAPEYLRLARGTTEHTVSLAALPTAGATALAPSARGTDAPATPENGPALAAPSPQLSAGTYSVRYTFVNNYIETAPSLPATVQVGTGEVLTALVPELARGMTGANIYAGPAGAERLVAANVPAGASIHVTGIPSDAATLPAGGLSIPTAPAVTAASGGSLTGDTYLSYTFYNSTYETLRSPETYQAFASPNGTAQVATAPLPSWAEGVRIYAGKAPGEGRLVAEVPGAAGSRITASVSRVVDSGISVSSVTTSWTELDATWVRASANTPWFDRGGDYNRETAALSLGGGAQVTADLTALVQAWADGSVPNRGVLLRSQGSTSQFASSDHAEAALRPVLTITYREKAGGPTVVLTSPQAGDEINGDAVISAAVTTPDPNTAITRVDFYANGALIGSDTQAPYSVTWSAANLPGGTYNLSARAYDQWGREGSSEWQAALVDTFENGNGLDPGATTVQPDPDRGLITLPVSRSAVHVSVAGASSEKPAESYPAENLLDSKTDTYWRSPGQPLASAQETARFDLNSSVTSASLTIRPRSAKDGLSVKLQAIDVNGDVIKESALVALDAETKAVSVSASKSFKAVRLVFSNLKRDLASGLYHAEVAEITGTKLNLAAVKSYQATYVSRNAADGYNTTHWVSIGQSSRTGQEYLEVSLAGNANALYIKPRTPGVTAMVATYRGQYEGWEPVLTIASLDEGLYPLPAGLDTSSLRLYFTNLVGTSGPDAPSTFFAGVDEVAAYQIGLQQDQAQVESRTLTLPAPATTLLLEADDSQPPGSSIAYAVFDGTIWHDTTPGIPLTLSAAVATVRVRATLKTESPMAIPTLSAWRLYARASHPVELLSGTDTIPPTAEVIVPDNPWLSGVITLKTAVWDNVGIDYVEFYADNTILLGTAEAAPFEFTLDTTTLDPGDHLFYVRAYDKAGNSSLSQLPTTTYQAFTDTFADWSKVDTQRTEAAVYGGNVINTTIQKSVVLSGAGTLSQAVTAGPGLVRTHAPVLSLNGVCVANSVQIKYNTSTVVLDQPQAQGTCRDLDATYGVKATSYGHTVVFSQDAAAGTYDATFSYYSPMSSTAPYSDTTVVTTPTVTAAPLAGVTVKATVSKPTGTDIRFYASANDGTTWQPVTLNEYTPFNHFGNRLRLKAELISAAGSGIAYKNLTPQLQDWTADVTQYLFGAGNTVSQIDPPGKVTAKMNGMEAHVSWEPSRTPGVTYDIYRSTDPNPNGTAYTVASGVQDTTFVDGKVYNLLKNSSFESSTLSYWTAPTHYHTTCCDETGAEYETTHSYTSINSTYAWAGLKSLRLYDSRDTSAYVYQDVVLGAEAGTTFSLSAMVKATSFTESLPYAVSLQLTYTDGTTAIARTGLPGGTAFDWTRRTATITATKPVSKLRAYLYKSGSGYLYFDGVQLDMKGAATWYDIAHLDPATTYYYRVVAVNADGVRSAPSKDGSTGAAAPVPTVEGLGIKGFWPYHNLHLGGGNGSVNLANGNLVFSATDVTYPDRLLNLAFGRTYNAQGASIEGPLGYGWDHAYNWTLTPTESGAVVLKDGDGTTFTFEPAAGGSGYVTPPGSRMKLVKADESYTIARYDNNQVYTFDQEDGKLLRITEPNGNALSMEYDVDAQGHARLLGVTSPAGKVMTLTYNAAGYIGKVTLPGRTNGVPREVTFEYDSAGNLIRAVDPEQNSTHFSYDRHHRLIVFTNANGYATQVEYSGEPGVVAHVTYSDDSTLAFAYGDVGDITGWTKSTVTDPRGFSVIYQVDANGLLKKHTFPYGTETPATTKMASTSFEHDEAWQVIQSTDPRDKVTKTTYDGYGNITSVTDPDNNVSRHFWMLKPYPGVPGQSLNVMVQSIDAMGGETFITTDARGNITRIQDPLLQVTENTYDEFGQQISTRNANGYVTRYEYDANGWLRKETDPLGSSVTHLYDFAGNATTVTDPVGNQTHYVYDGLGRQTQITLPDGAKQHFVYDAIGNVVQTTDPNGAISRYEYDTMGRALKLRQWPTAGDEASVFSVTYEYDKAGLRTAVTDARGKRSTTTYDGAGRILAETNPLGHKTTYTYDAAGNTLTVTDPLNNTVTMEYDSLNRRTKTVTPQDTSNSMSTTVTYDALSRKTSETDALGRTTTYYYDALSRLSMVVDPMGFGTNYAYDAMSNRAAVTDAQRRTTHYVYDAVGQLVEEKRPDGTSVFTKYDAVGRKVAYTNGRNQTVEYRYDNRNQLAEISYPDGRTVRYGYDATGHRTSMIDWTGTTRYQYNQMGWLLQTEDPWGHQVSYTYDNAGSRTQMDLQYSGVHFTWTYAYDDAGRLTKAQSPGVAKATDFTYDNASRLAKMAYANGDTVTYGYNKAGQQTSIKNTNTTYPGGTSAYVMNFSYVFDKAGQRTQIGRSVKSTTVGTTYYKYDAGGRLSTSGSTSSTKDMEYYHDLVGNRHTMVANTGDSKGVTTYVYDDANRLIEEFGPLSTEVSEEGRYHQSYTYDADGSQTRVEKDGKEVTLYYYDEDARLLQVTNSLGQATRYTYNGDGKRVRMEEPAGATVFIYDGTEVLAEADATGTILVAYTRTPGGQLVSQWQRGETYWYHLDGLGSTVALTDESGRVRNDYAYSDYGKVLGGSREVSNRFTFTGQAWDEIAGLYHYKARYYDPEVGRFLSQDTYKGSAWLPWTQNLYTYVGNNPVNYIDPTGHNHCKPGYHYYVESRTRGSITTTTRGCEPDLNTYTRTFSLEEVRGVATAAQKLQDEASSWSSIAGNWVGGALGVIGLAAAFVPPAWGVSALLLSGVGIATGVGGAVATGVSWYKGAEASDYEQVNKVFGSALNKCAGVNEGDKEADPCAGVKLVGYYYTDSTTLKNIKVVLVDSAGNPLLDENGKEIEVEITSGTTIEAGATQNAYLEAGGQGQ